MAAQEEQEAATVYSLLLILFINKLAHTIFHYWLCSGVLLSLNEFFPPPVVKTVDFTVQEADLPRCISLRAP